MSINRYIPFALVYFFVNALLLPFGLTWMALLTPFFCWWILSEKGSGLLLPACMALAGFGVIHFAGGVDLGSFILSNVNYLTVIVFCAAFSVFLHQVDDLHKILRFLFYLNIVVCLTGVVFYVAGDEKWLWSVNALTDGLDNFRRFKAFTYEPSYYALLCTPLFFYFLWDWITDRNRRMTLLTAMGLLLPFILSFSIGVIFCVCIAIALVSVFHFRHVVRLYHFRIFCMVAMFSLLAGLVIGFFFFPENDLFYRLENIFSGNDTSGNGRTSDAFLLAGSILDLKNPLWGVGAGQIKILGGDIIRDYYLYDLDYETIAIPNAVAETWAIFGSIGLVMRFGLETFFFFRQRVWSNYFRLCLFLFVFIYQFTGSFITNLAEYVLWIMAFTPVFRQFAVHKLKPGAS